MTAGPTCWAGPLPLQKDQQHRGWTAPVCDFCTAHTWPGGHLLVRLPPCSGSVSPCSPLGAPVALETLEMLAWSLCSPWRISFKDVLGLGLCSLSPL